MSRKESRVRFIPLENSSLFSLNRPFHAVIRNTQDPKIKKLVLIEDSESHGDQEVVNTVLSRPAFDAVKTMAKAHQTSVSAVIESIVEGYLKRSGASATPPLEEFAANPAAFAAGAGGRSSTARAARMAALEQGGKVAGEVTPGNMPAGHGAAGPVDYIISNVVEASVLILDSLNSDSGLLPKERREETYTLIHHALGTLMALKRGEDGGFFSEAGKERLLTILSDLESFRAIADEEEQAGATDVPKNRRPKK